jgi:hypothetical protein
MSKWCLVAVGLLVCMASVSFAQDPLAVYPMGGMPDPYAGPTPSGMRFGDMGQVMSVQTGDVEGGYVGGPGCPGCGFGAQGTPCDPCWRGPCIDWKLVGWYSNWRDKNHGCGGGCRCRGCDTCCY